MFYIAYRTTNLINNKYYLGVHATEILKDGYLGSGKVFKQALKKYGRESFRREIVKTFSTEKEMYEYERDVLVTEQVVQDARSYNMVVGGSGGFKVTDIDEWKRKLKASRKGKTPSLGLKHTNESKQKMSISRKGMKAWNKGMSGTFTGRKHSEETKLLQSSIKKGLYDGEKNPMFGKSAVKGRKWYNNGVETFYLFPDDPLCENLTLGRLKFRTRCDERHQLCS